MLLRQWPTALKKTAVDQYASNGDDAIGWLGTAENALSQSVTSVSRIQTLVSAGSNATSDATSRKALSDEIATIKQSLIGLANSSYNNRSIFAGTANPAGLTPPKAAYDADGTYNGNAGTVNRTIGAGASVQVNVAGQTVFGTNGVDDIWTLLDEVNAHLTSADPVERNKLISSYTAGGVSVPGRYRPPGCGHEAHSKRGI